MSNNLQYIITDSSSLVSLLSEDDSNFQKAKKLVSKIKNTLGRILIPAEVYSETMNVLGKKIGHTLTVEKINNFLDSPIVIIIESNNEIRLAALAMFQKSPSSVSYTDCLVMAFADHFETKIILGFDEVFTKSGYKLPG